MNKTKPITFRTEDDKYLITICNSEKMADNVFERNTENDFKLVDRYKFQQLEVFVWNDFVNFN